MASINYYSSSECGSESSASSQRSKDTVIYMKNDSSAQKRKQRASANLRNPENGSVITYGESSTDEESSEDARSEGYWR